MSTVRETWTDERLDDLNERVAEQTRRMDDGFKQLNARLDSLQRTILQVGGGLFATFAVGFLGLVFG